MPLTEILFNWRFVSLECGRLGVTVFNRANNSFVLLLLRVDAVDVLKDRADSTKAGRALRGKRTN